MPARNVGTLADEIKQTKPFRSLSHEAVLGLMRTHEVVRNFVIDQIGLDGITLPQYNVLRILRGAGADGLPTLEIAARLVERTPGVTRMINRLIQKGVVERERCESDRRVVFCRITAKGLDLLERYDAPVTQSHEEALRMLSATEQEQLVLLLDKVRAHLKQESAGD